MDAIAPPLLLLPFRDREDMRRNLSERDRPTVFVDGDIELPVGSKLRVEVQFLEDGVNLLTDAVLAFRRVGTSPGTNLRPGIGVELTPGPDTKLLLDYARGLQLVPRGDRRFEVKMRARCKHPQGTCWGVVRDLSESGAAVVAPVTVVVGDMVDLRLYPSGTFLGIKTRAVVRWAGEEDFGVKFNFGGERGERKLKSVVERAQQERRDAARLELVPSR